MLMDILMEALMAMDDETLDSVLESCDAEELEIISEVMEATAMTAKDKEDFNTIERIQRKARSSGWGSVPKADRDKFVNIMSNTDNLKVLKKAKSLGEREASHDDRVKGALRSLGMTAGGAAIGAGTGAVAGKIQGQKDALDILSKKANDAIDTARKNNDYVRNDLEKYANAVNAQRQRAHDICDDLDNYMYSYRDDYIADADSLLRDLKDLPDGTRINIPHVGTFTSTNLDNIINSSIRSGSAKGFGVGALAGASLSAITAAVKKAKRYNKDTKDVKAQGDSMHPDAQWMANRKLSELRNKSIN